MGMIKIKITKTVLPIILFFMLTAFGVWHKFYVSVTQIDYNEPKKRIEISTRIFTDDLEKVLNEVYAEKLNLATKLETPQAKEKVVSYIKSHLKIDVNNKEKELIYLGSEYEDNLIICYFKIDYSKKIGTFEVFNDILTDKFSEQQNIVHTNIHTNKKSVLLTRNNKSEKLNY